MMITYKKLTGTPHLFKCLTGVSVTEFEELLQKLEPVWLQTNYERLDRPNRQRGIGGGPNYKLKLRDRLLMTLILLHSALNTNTLGYFFAVDKSTVSRNTRNILPALYQLKNGTSPWPRPPKRGEGKSFAQILQEYPDLGTVIGVTEQSM
jgi:hypothetical protein